MIKPESIEKMKKSMDQMPAETTKATIFAFVDDKGQGQIVPLGDVDALFSLKEKISIMMQDAFLRGGVKMSQIIPPKPGPRIPEVVK